MKRIVLTPTKLRAWLEAQEPGTIVGRRQANFGCPIAEFLLASGWDTAEATQRVISVRPADYGAKPIVREAPAWARLFMCIVDSGWTLNERDVTRDQALEALQRATA
jgi:hypothetical protein